MAKPGPKRSKTRERFPSGKPKMEDPRRTAVHARMRMHGLPEDDARTDLAGYAVGRLALSGKLGKDWRPLIDAANGYVYATARYMRLKFPSWPIPKAMDFLAVKGLGGEPSFDEVQNIIRRYERYREILAGVDGISRMKFHQIAFDDEGKTTEHATAVRKCATAIIEGLAKKPKS